MSRIPFLLPQMRQGNAGPEAQEAIETVEASVKAVVDKAFAAVDQVLTKVGEAIDQNAAGTGKGGAA